MSAFLKYSQKRRSIVKQQNPDMENTDVSRLLGEMWRNASASERAPYEEIEEKERAQFKEQTKKWRDSQAKMDAASRTSHHSVQHSSDHPPQKAPHATQERKAQQPNQYDPVRMLSMEHPYQYADRRVFRSYCGPPMDESGRGQGQAMYPYHGGSSLDAHGKEDQHMYNSFPAPEDERSKTEKRATSSVGVPHQQPFRMTYYQGELNQISHLSLDGMSVDGHSQEGVDSFQTDSSNSEVFSSRQPVSSSRYFPEAYYQYPRM